MSILRLSESVDMIFAALTSDILTQGENSLVTALHLLPDVIPEPFVMDAFVIVGVSLERPSRFNIVSRSNICSGGF